MTHMVGGVCGDAHSKGQRNSCWPSIVAKVPRVGRPGGAPNQGRPHNADWEPGRVVAADQNLCHALSEEVGVGRPGLLQVPLHLRGSRDSAQRQRSEAPKLGTTLQLIAHDGPWNVEADY